MPRRRALSGMGSVYKESDSRRLTRWVAEVVVPLPNGLKKRVRARGRTAEDAVRERDRRADAVRVANPSADRMTISELSERWLAARSHALKPSTVATYRKSLAAYVLPVVGRVRVSRFTALEAQAVVNATLAKASARGDMRAAADRARRVMSAMLQQAADWGLVSVNPLDRVPRVRPTDRERGYWTRPEVESFLAAARGEAYEPFFLAALATGLRLGELLALRWGDVEGLSFVVRRTFSSDTGEVQEAPKSASGRRRVPITQALREALGPAGRGDALVFPSRTGRVLSPSSVRRALDRVQARVEGLPRLKVHDLRRTYASLLAADGHHPSIIQKLLGHASSDLALRVYTSVSEETLAGAVVRVGGGASGGNSGGVGVRQGGVRRAKVRRVEGVERARGTRVRSSGARGRGGRPRNS